MCYRYFVYLFIFLFYGLYKTHEQAEQHLYITQDKVSLENRRIFSPAQHEGSKVDLESRMNVVLYTRTRQGSTFASEFLYQHYDVFYSFEPLVFADDHVTKNSTTDILRKVFGCKFLEVAEKCDDPKCLQWAQQSFCYYDGRRFCKRWTLQEEGKHCLTKRLRVAKITRAPSLDHLSDLIRDSHSYEINPKVKVIQLIRDPRGLISSRLKEIYFTKHGRQMNDSTDVPKIYFNDGLQSAAKTYCKEMESDIKFITKAIKDQTWEQADYLMIRYEDLAMYPLENGEKMFRFLNLRMAKNVRNWILKGIERKAMLKKVYEDESLYTVCEFIVLIKSHLTYFLGMSYN